MGSENRCVLNFASELIAFCIITFHLLFLTLTREAICHRQRLELSAAVVCIPCPALPIFARLPWRPHSVRLLIRMFWASWKVGTWLFLLVTDAATEFFQANSTFAPIFMDSSSSG